VDAFVGIVVGAVLVDNLVLARLAGVGGALSPPQPPRRAIVDAFALAIVVALASAANHGVDVSVLRPYGLAYLRPLAFVLVALAALPLLRVTARHARLEWIAVEAQRRSRIVTAVVVVLAAGLVNAERDRALAASMLFGFAVTLGHGFVASMFAAMRARLDVADVPDAFRGAPIGLVTLALLALAFAGFAGMATS
jgi:electron transport complex protein RnfA